ncbi:MAG: hypothetical protein HY816_11410 [Candidatus Wallbacteria bacterium]|nr:hypothetical protein [Candidatus Wallbacteria bacterium]
MQLRASAVRPSFRPARLAARAALSVLGLASALTLTAGPVPAQGAFDHQRMGLFDILYREPEALAVDVPVGRDTVPPRVVRVQLVTFPDDPARRQVHEAGNVFVGIGNVEVRVTVSEPMASPPRVQLRHTGGLPVEAGLTDGSANPLFVYRVFPVPSPATNGPATLEITGEFDGQQPDWGYDRGPNVATDQASGVDWSQVGSLVTMRVFDPRGRQLPGMVVARQPALVLMMPDPYDPRGGVFTDTDGDGRADPIEGTYRIEVDLTDLAGNRSNANLSLGLDATPVAGSGVSVSINPVFSQPFPNPSNPIPGSGASVRRLERVEIQGSSPDFDPARSTAKLLSRLGGPTSVPREVLTSLSRVDGKLVLTVSRDQDGDGRDDFENPAPGPYLPPGETDPRLGRNDGTYLVEVRAADSAGNVAVIVREFVLDTTSPRGEPSAPTAGVRLRGPLRVVDAFLDDPAASNGNPGSGIQLSASGIQLDFRGNAGHPAARVPGIAFVHSPNATDPTRPDYNPRDTRYKILFEILDGSGQPASLPVDGSADGVYLMTVRTADRAGNDATFVTSFEYTQAATAPLTAPLTLWRP